jgi:hypothetical protein
MTDVSGRGSRAFVLIPNYNEGIRNRRQWSTQ